MNLLGTSKIDVSEKKKRLCQYSIAKIIIYLLLQVVVIVQGYQALP